MSAFDRELVATKAAAIERHLARIAARLPQDAADLLPATDASDAVILHLWQAVQLVLDLGFAACLHLRLATPATYADAFRALAREGIIDEPLAERLARAVGLRNVIAHAYEDLDMALIHAAAIRGPADLRAFLKALAALAARPAAGKP